MCWIADCGPIGMSTTPALTGSNPTIIPATASAALTVSAALAEKGAYCDSTCLLGVDARRKDWSPCAADLSLQPAPVAPGPTAAIVGCAPNASDGKWFLGKSQGSAESGICAWRLFSRIPRFR